jgi:ATP-dependent Clp protease ATP-binding subunit ClpA
MVILIVFWITRKSNLKLPNLSGGSPLNIYTSDLTAKAKAGEIDPVIGRDEEIERVVQILSRRTKNNPLLIGAAGVGKTAIVEGLALRIVTGNIPHTLIDKKVLVLNLSDMMAGTKYRGDLENRVQKIVESIIAQRRQVILFIDEIHTLVQTKGTEGAMNITDIIKPALARGELQTIGATTIEEYNNYIAKDEALERRFQLVEINAPTVEQSITILKGIKDKYELHHQVIFEDAAIEAAVRLSDEHIRNRNLPDKAIDVIDEAGASVNMHAHDLPDHALKLIQAAAQEVHRKIKDAPKEIKKLLAELEELKIADEKTESENEHEDLQKKIITVTTEIEELENHHRDDLNEKSPPVVRVRDIQKVIEQWIGKKI